MSEMRRAATLWLTFACAFAFALGAPLFGGLDQAAAQGTADLNADQSVDAQDQLLFIDQWHTGGSNVPAGFPPAGQVNTQIMSVDMSAVDNRPEVTLSMLDGNGEPIDVMNEVSDARFSIARIFEDANTGSHYENYIAPEVANQVGDASIGTVTATLATYDHAGRAGGSNGFGSLTDMGGGTWVYKFGDEVVMGPGDESRTHTVVIQLTVNTEFGQHRSNPLFHFVPDGSPVTVLREVVNTETCNACHTKLGLHGGGRTEIAYCIVCHNPAPGNFDPDSGNSIDMAEMIHKIHRGANLPSAPTEEYVIYGYRNTPHNYSHVHYPQDIRNCESCHAGATPAPGDAQEDNWKMFPSRRACGSCHDDVDFVTGAGHGAGIPQADDTSCTGCHPADTGGAAAIAETHTPPHKAPELAAGVNAEVLSAENMVPGASPAARFRLFNDAGDPLDISGFDRVRLMLAGPTSNYVERTSPYVWRPDRDIYDVTDEGGGVYRYQFEDVIDASAVGTYAIGLEAYTSNIALANGGTARGIPDNPILYVALDGGTPEPRRVVVDTAKCNVCHDRLVEHGRKTEVEYCVMCHYPTAEGDAPAGATGEEDIAPSVHFKNMIHKLHTGEAADNPLVIGNDDYSELVFPGLRNECTICHVEGTQELPLPEGVADTVVFDETGTELYRLQPIESACRGCHTSDLVATHTETQISFAGGSENCVDCHGPSKQWAVDLVHWANLD